MVKLAPRQDGELSQSKENHQSQSQQNPKRRKWVKPHAEDTQWLFLLEKVLQEAQENIQKHRTNPGTIGWPKHKWTLQWIFDVAISRDGWDCASIHFRIYKCCRDTISTIQPSKLPTKCVLNEGEAILWYSRRHRISMYSTSSTFKSITSSSKN